MYSDGKLYICGGGGGGGATGILNYSGGSTYGRRGCPTLPRTAARGTKGRECACPCI